ncbi:hypothetical protein AN964_13995 [Heyndrickxia shackletonii]|uniref:YhjD n=1 Tax=Heyndrickxia shackletonii TaxID=157838 RepID=A0A0Q3WXX5_9BACI|nr:hypothetical protein [Heyndrickxia shackletonii]KQL54501.1 hypothetical protein AN964_13995 [Heyndrickxia shackletonii]NEY99228.1 hypothetical protein [Heyndrickxia shackletonii]
MVLIPDKDREVIEKAIYLPMLVIVLNQDLQIINTSPIKLKKPYTEWIEETIRTVQKELSDVKRYMKQNRIKVEKIKTEESFTEYVFIYKGYEDKHRYFNPRLKNRTEELLEYYLYQRYNSTTTKNFLD